MDRYALWIMEVILCLHGDKEPYTICELGKMKREVNTSGFSAQQVESLSKDVMSTIFMKTISSYMGMNKQSQYFLFIKLMEL